MAGPIAEMENGLTGRNAVERRKTLFSATVQRQRVSFTKFNLLEFIRCGTFEGPEVSQSKSLVKIMTISGGLLRNDGNGLVPYANLDDCNNSNAESSDPSSITAPSGVSNFGKPVDTSALRMQLRDKLDGRKWQDALLLLKANNDPDGITVREIISRPFGERGGDYALHDVCDWDYFPNAVKDAAPGGNHMEPPPLELITFILEAYPKATRIRGQNGCLPLHYACRGSAPKNIMELLIRAYPQGLDMKDDLNQTPRDFHQYSPESASFLDRPTSCWVQQLADDGNRAGAEEEISILEHEILQLTIELAEEKELEQHLEERMISLEKTLAMFDEKMGGKQLETRVSELQNEVEEELLKLNSKLAEIESRMKASLIPAQEDRKYTREFNEDMHRLYKIIDKTATSLNKDVEDIKRMVAT